MLNIDRDIHYPIMELSPEDRRDRKKHRPPHHHVDAADRGTRGDLEFAR
jgi:hypothetical protein